MRPTTGVPVPTGPGGLAPTDDERMLAMVAHLGNPASFLVGLTWIAAIVLYFVKKDESKFVAFHALQSIYLLLAGVVLAIPTCGIAVLAVLVLGIIGGIKAHAGELYEYPVIGKWARRSVFGA